jgi:hypothetical protein
LGVNTTGANNAAFGNTALSSNTTGSNNAAFGGFPCMTSNTTGGNNVAMGNGALNSNTTASNNTAVGYQAGYTQTSPSVGNTYLGYQAGYAVTTGYGNFFAGRLSGNAITTGYNNTIIGTYSGNSGGLDIRTASNFIVLSDGDGNPKAYFHPTYGTWYLGNGTAGVYFPQTASVSGRNCVTLDTSVGAVSATGNGDSLGGWNRNNADGDLHRFYTSGTQQGSISVSGATVSYNSFAGSHWSQTLAEDKPEILQGTVMESLDEMCNWPNESNDRLPKAKVSDTAGSKKVYGVFMAWEIKPETNTNDMLLTGVGAFFCRVNVSATVQRGDLLESNGDGTARVQADDVVRSNTIGKVTSTEKSVTYSDGSYCVPTVLYCG